jgi:phosphatidylcholine synthase
VLYLFVLDAPLWFNVAVLAVLSVLVFVPIRYLYPSRAAKARKRTYLLGIVWGTMVIWLVLQFPSPSRPLALVSLFFPAYYVALSIKLHLNSPPSPVAERE